MKAVSKKYAVILIVLMLLTLCACGKKAEKPVKTTISTVGNTAAEVSEPETLAGDWFGWWNMYNATGEWSGHNGVCLDLCASIKSVQDGYEILLWDENFTRDYYLAKIRISKKNGAYYCAGGDMMNITLEKNACTVSMPEENYLTITGNYYGTHKGKFDYRMYLRTWGAQWDSDDRPYNYDTWYLPLINSGSAMPDKIG